MGEVEVVMNGVEFCIRYNDFELRMLSKINQNYYVIEKIFLLVVFLLVLSKYIVVEQIIEMQNYFKVWKYQDYCLRDYRLYFKVVLCYMEVVWMKDIKIVKDEFFND